MTPNQGWRNAGLPARDWSGDRTGNPPLALDLHYLLTATAPRDIYPEIIMGFAMQMLHETGVLSRELIAKALDPMAPPSDFIPQLKFAELAEQVEQIRVTPAALTVDDISKLWTGFQGRYRMSVAYIVTVVLIQTLRSTRSSLPVVTRNIAVKPFQQIVIDEITSSTPYALAGSTLSIAGTNLDDPNFQLFIDGADNTALVTGRSATVVTVKLPAPIGSALRAGRAGRADRTSGPVRHRRPAHGHAVQSRARRAASGDDDSRGAVECHASGHRRHDLYQRDADADPSIRR